MITTTLLTTGGGDAAPTGGLDSNLLINVALFALLALVIIFMFRSSRKRRADAAELQTKMLPGVEVMTQHGIYGTLVSVDEEKNEAVIETTPGTRLRVHRQTLARVVEPEVAAESRSESAAAEPEFGERSDDEKPKRSPRKKPTE